jgi:hypothetical protein
MLLCVFDAAALAYHMICNNVGEAREGIELQTLRYLLTYCQ